MANDIQFGIRISADGSGAITEAGKVVHEFGKIDDAVKKTGKAAKETTGAFAEMKSVFGALQLDRLFSEVVSGLSNMVRETISFAGALNDLSDATGSTVENLSSLANQATISGVGIAELETALFQMSKRLSVADEESKRAGDAMRAIGVSAQDPAEALREVAIRFNEYADGANKIALAQAIFGRSGAKLLPMLKDMANQSREVATVTQQQAKDADKLEESWRALGVQGNAFKTFLLSDLVPALTKTITAFNLARAAGLGFGEALDMSAVGNDRTEQRIAELEKDIERFRAKQRSGKSLFGFEDWPKAIETAEAKLRVLRTLLEQQNSARWDAAYPSRNSAGGSKPEAPGLPDMGAAAAAKDEAERVAKAMVEQRLAIVESGAGAELAIIKRRVAEQVITEQAGIEATLAVRLDMLQREAAVQAEVFQKAKPGSSEQIEAYTKLIVLSGKMGEASAAAGEDIAKANTKAAAALEKFNDEARSAYATAAKQVEATEAEAKAQSEHAEEIGKTKEQILLLEAARINDAIATLEQTRAAALWGNESEEDIALINREIAALAKLREGKVKAAGVEGATAVKDAWNKQTDMIAQSLTDALMRGFESGKDFAQNFVSTLKNLFSTLVLRPLIQGIVQPIAGGVSSAVGGAFGLNTGGAGGGIGNLAGGAMNLAGGGGASLLGYGGISGMFAGSGGIFGAGAIGNGFALSGAGQALGLSAVGLDAAGGVALTTLGTTLGAVIPVIGAVIAIGMLVKSFLDSKKGGPKVGGYGSAGEITAWDRTQHFTPNQADPEMAKAAKSILTSFDATMRSLGGKGGGAGFDIGFDTDPQGKANSRLGVRAFVGGKQVYDYWSGDNELGDDPEALQARIGLETRRALLAAVQASELPSQVAAVLNTVTAETADEAAIDNIFKLAGSIKALLDATDATTLGEDISKSIEAAQRTPFESVAAMGVALTELAGKFDGTQESTDQLLAATQQYRNAVVQTVVAISQLQTAFTKLFASTRTQIEMAGLSKQATYDILRDKARGLTNSLELATDPEAVKTIGEQINAYMLQAFGLLSPDEQLAKKPEFLANLSAVETAVNAQLEKIKTSLTGDAVDPLTAVRTALDAAVIKMSTAATDQKTAADQMTIAANTMTAAAEKIDGATINIRLTDQYGGGVGAAPNPA